MTSGMYRLDLLVSEDPFRDMTGGCRALCVAYGGGEVPRVVPRVLRYIRVPRVADGGVAGYRVEPVCAGFIRTRGVSQSLRGVGDPLWEEGAERISAVVWDSVPASGDMRIKSGAAWRAPPSFDVLRMAA